jgi:carbonic anhydrase/acetyltransferase-like protein (isoleucine patch superfamily)
MRNLREQMSRFLGRQPRFGSGVFTHRSASIIGAVTLGDFSSVWCQATLRGDINEVTVGNSSNIQDNCVLHVADDFACTVGNFVTVGHSAILHACTIEDEVLVGMGATVLDGAVVGRQSIVGAKALVTAGMQVPPGSLVLGVPGKVVRPLSEAERATLKGRAEKYVGVAAFYIELGSGV